MFTVPMMWRNTYHVMRLGFNSFFQDILHGCVALSCVAVAAPELSAIYLLVAVLSRPTIGTKGAISINVMSWKFKAIIVMNVVTDAASAATAIGANLHAVRGSRDAVVAETSRPGKIVCRLLKGLTQFLWDCITLL